jgi:hypothetical protein
MRDSISATKFDRWIKYYEDEPWGLEVDDLLVGHIVSALTNPHLKKGAKPLTALDARLFKLTSKEPQTVEEQQLAAKRILAVFGGAAPSPKSE